MRKARVSLNRQRLTPTLTHILSFAGCIAALGGLAGCPVGADLEDPDRFPDLNTGGTGGSGTAGSAGTTTAGTTGASGAGSLVVDGVTCDYTTGLKKSCALSVCHGTRVPYAGLNLTPDAGFIARVKDIDATNRDLDCDPTEGYLACETPPMECGQFLTVKLIDSANPDASYLLTKMSASGCGNQMPIEPGNSPSNGWSDDRKACLEQTFRAIAGM